MPVFGTYLADHSRFAPTCLGTPPGLPSLGMDALATLAFTYLAAKVVWEGTEMRVGSMDELRTLLAAIAALTIVAGVGVLA